MLSLSFQDPAAHALSYRSMTTSPTCVLHLLLNLDQVGSANETNDDLGPHLGHKVAHFLRDDLPLLAAMSGCGGPRGCQTYISWDRHCAINVKQAQDIALLTISKFTHTRRLVGR